MRYKKLRNILAAVLGLILLCSILTLTLTVLVENPSVQHYLLGQLSRATGYRFKAGDLKLTFHEGIGFSARDLVAESQVKPTRIEASKLRVTLDTKNLIKGRIVPALIWIYRPRIEISVTEAPGPLKTGGQRAFANTIISTLSELRFFSLKRGNLHINGFPFKIEALDLDVYPDKTGPARVQVRLHAQAVSKKHRTPFTLQGSMAGDTSHGSHHTADLTVKTEYFPLTWLPWPSSLAFNKGVGKADIKLRVSPDEPLTARGKITMEDVQFAFVRRGKTKNYIFGHLESDFASNYSKKNLEISSLNLKGRDFLLRAGLHIDFKDKTDPCFVLKIESPFLPLETFKKIYPTPFPPLWLKEKLFPLLSGGKARLSSLLLNGTRDQLRHLHLPANRDVFSLKIGWKNITALRDRGGLPFEKVTGVLNIEKGTLSTDISHAVFGSSTITHASLNVRRLYDGAHTNCVSMEGLFDLQDIKGQENLNVSHNFWRHFLNRYDSLSGKMEGRIQVVFDRSWNHPRILDGKFHATGCSVACSGLPLPFFLDEADLQIDGQGEPRFQGAGHWGESDFEISGSTDSLWQNCKLKVLSRLHMEELVDRFYSGPPFSIKQKGLVSCHADLYRKNGVWSCRGDMGLNNITLKRDFASLNLQGKADRAFFDVDICPGEKLTLNNLKLVFGTSALNLNGSWGLNKKGAMDVSLYTEKLILDTLGIQTGSKNIPAKGVISCHARLKSASGNPQKTSVTGTLAGKNMSFAMDELPAPVTDCRFKLDFLQKDVFIRFFHMRMGESILNAQGHLTGWAGLKGDIKAKAGHLNLADFVPQKTGSVKKTPQHRIFREKSDVQVFLNAGEARWKKLTFRPFKATFGFHSDGFYIRHAEVRMPHGSISIHAPEKTKAGHGHVSFISDIKMTKQPMDDLIASFGLKNGVKGLLTMEAHLSAKSAEIKDVVTGLTGKADVLLENGRIKRKRGIIPNVLAFLSLRNIIKLKMPDLSRNGFPFESLSANITIREGKLKTDDLIFKSPAFNAAAQGTVYLSARRVDFDLWVQTLETMDSIVSKVPIIGYILTGKDNSPKGVIIYPLEVKGQWSDPEITSSVLKNLGGGVIDIFKRILLTPGRIFKGISDMTTGWSKSNEFLSENKTDFHESAGTESTP